MALIRLYDGHTVGAPRAYIPAENMLYKLLVNSTGRTNMNTSTTDDFGYTVAAGEIALLERVNIVAQNANIKPETFFGETALSIGITVEVVGEDGVQVLDFCDGHPFQKDNEFGWLAGSDVIVGVGSGASEDTSIIRWTLGKSGAGCRLTSGQRFQFVVLDNLNEISELSAMLQGIVGTVKQMTGQ